MIGFLLSPFRTVGKGCLFGFGCLLGVIIFLVILALIGIGSFNISWLS